MAALSKAEIQMKLNEIPGWSLAGNAIHKKFQFKSFMSAIAFVNEAAGASEKANHHPDIDIRYSAIEINLTTHSEGGITNKDFRLAKELDEIAAGIS